MMWLRRGSCNKLQGGMGSFRNGRIIGDLAKGGISTLLPCYNFLASHWTVRNAVQKRSTHY
jgi:hypothetical protein